MICPTAPIIPVTVNMGAKMPAWFDILSLDRNDEGGADLKGLDLASSNLRGMAEAEMKHHGIARYINI